MSRRAAHGKAREHGAVVVYETPPTDELKRPTQAAGTDPIATGRDSAGRVRTSAAAAALARLPRASKMLPRKVACHPAFAAKQDQRREWLVKRRTELHNAHGGVSHGVGARLNAAAWLYAAAEFCAEQGALTLETEWFKTAASLSATARTHDDAAWEMAALEASTRPEEPFDLNAALRKGLGR